MRLRLVRHATLRLDLGGRRVLVDPQLDPAGAREGVPGTPDPRPSPLVGLPEPAEVVAREVDLLLVTHLHQDHLDATALALLPRDVPVLGQPEDAEALRVHGFADVRPVEDAVDLDGLRVTRTGARHGHDPALAAQMAPASGFVLEAPGEPVVYVAGDTVWADEVRAALERHRPAVVVVNAGAASFLEGGAITMTADEVVEVARQAPDATVVAVHFETVSHCVESRAVLHEAVREHGLGGRVVVPEDGTEVPIPAR